MVVFGRHLRGHADLPEIIHGADTFRLAFCAAQAGQQQGRAEKDHERESQQKDPLLTEQLPERKRNFFRLRFRRVARGFALQQAPGRRMQF